MSSKPAKTNKPKEKKLTIKESKYCDYRFEGLSQRQAYKKAFKPKKMTDHSVDTKASELEKRVEIQCRLQELRNKHSEAAGLSVEQKRLFLMNLVTNDQESRNDLKLKAIDLDNKMMNIYTNKSEVKLSFDFGSAELTQ